jgi:hypothetical protein
MGSVVCLSEGGCVESPASGLTPHVQTQSQHIHAYTSEYSNDHLKEKKVLNKSPHQSAIFPPMHALSDYIAMMTIGQPHQ